MVFFFKRPKSAGHSTTACVQHPGRRSRHTFNQPRHESGVKQRLGMAVGVNGNVLVQGSKSGCCWFPGKKIIDEFLEQETALGKPLGAGDLQLTIIFDKHRVAGRLEKQNWSFGGPSRTGMVE